MYEERSVELNQMYWRKQADKHKDQIAKLEALQNLSITNEGHEEALAAATKQDAERAEAWKQFAAKWSGDKSEPSKVVQEVYCGA